MLPHPSYHNGDFLAFSCAMWNDALRPVARLCAMLKSKLARSSGPQVLKLTMVHSHRWGVLVRQPPSLDLGIFYHRTAASTEALDPDLRSLLLHMHVLSSVYSVKLIRFRSCCLDEIFAHTTRMILLHMATCSLYASCLLHSSPVCRGF